MAEKIKRIEVGSRLSRAVVHGDVVYLAGIVDDKPAGKNTAEQTVTILEQIDILLEKAGTDNSRLLSAQIWLTDMATFAEMNHVWEDWIRPHEPPARATTEARLASGDRKVEIMVIAAK